MDEEATADEVGEQESALGSCRRGDRDEKEREGEREAACGVPWGQSMSYRRVSYPPSPSG